MAGIRIPSTRHVVERVLIDSGFDRVPTHCGVVRSSPKEGKEPRVHIKDSTGPDVSCKFGGVGAVKAKSTRELFEQAVQLERQFGRLRRRRRTWEVLATISLLLVGAGVVDGFATALAAR